MRARCALKFIPSTPAVLPYLRKNCRNIAKLKEGPLTPEGKKRQKWFEYNLISRPFYNYVSGRIFKISRI